MADLAATVLTYIAESVGPGPDVVAPATPVAGAVSRIRSYMEDDFSGGFFERYGIGRIQPDHITGDDIIAVTMLSIQVSRSTTGGFTPESLRALDRLDAEVHALLSLLPVDRELHSLSEAEFDRWMGAGSPGDRLYALLRNSAGVPRVASHKLLARKRPHLFPVRDTVVERALGLQDSPEWWRPWWQALSGDHGRGLVAELTALRGEAGAHHLSLLRVADIAIWMAKTSNGSSSEEDTAT